MGTKRRVLTNKLGNFAFAFGQRAFLKQDVAAAERRGERLGLLLHRFDKKHRTRTERNLRLAFPEWSDEQIEQTALGVFRHFGRITGDFMRSPLRTKEEVLASVETSGLENLEQAEAKGKGILLVTAHFGNWERFAHWLTSSGRKMSVVARDADEEGLNTRILQMREMAGVEVLSRGAAARPILTKLKAREMVGILNDQNAGDAFVPFFGKPCGTVTGPAVLSARTGAPIVPAYCIWLSPGKYLAEFHPVVTTDGKTPEEITAELNLVLEGVVRRYPEQWLWMHDRWKSARQKGLL